ncbi:MAG: molecular chaperone TorD family protein [Thiomargarita sp.]|nr:molecular chaperone TorD family protein [Thiomargarita sp.]
MQNSQPINSIPIQWFKENPLEKPGINSEIANIAFLAQADLLLLITKLFAPPTAKMKQDLQVISPSDVDKLLKNSKLPTGENLATTYRQIQQQIQEIDLDIWVEEYNRLFEAKVACPINESGFISRDKEAILADIAGFYKAFGLKLSKAMGEKTDHLIGELEFVIMLLVMLTKTEQLEEKKTARNALNTFTFDHLSEWLPTFCEQLTKVTGLVIYQQSAEFLSMTWTAIMTANQLANPIKTTDDDANLDDDTTL